MHSLLFWFGFLFFAPPSYFNLECVWEIMCLNICVFLLWKLLLLPWFIGFMLLVWGFLFVFKICWSTQISGFGCGFFSAETHKPSSTERFIFFFPSNMIYFF